MSINVNTTTGSMLLSVGTLYVLVQCIVAASTNILNYSKETSSCTHTVYTFAVNAFLFLKLSKNTTGTVW